MTRRGKVEAPFTEWQVKSLNAFQEHGTFHPFTCGNDNCPHPKYEHSVLYAQEDGWHCPNCDYTQNWAHAGMANWDWELERIFGDYMRVHESSELLNLDSQQLIGNNPNPHTRFDQLMSNPCHKDWDQWRCFCNGWMEGRIWLLSELKKKINGDQKK